MPKTETKFTPGPWTLGNENNEHCEVLLGTQHNLTANLDRQDGNTSRFVIERDEMLANAHLIIAAPEMYHSAKESSAALYAWVNEKGIGAFEYSRRSAIIARHEAALAKAEGEL